MVRHGLEADAPYADAIVHADGLISLQYRLQKGRAHPGDPGALQVKARRHGHRPARAHRGSVHAVGGRKDGKTFRPVGSVSVPLGDREVHAGLAVCSHEAKALATAPFRAWSSRTPGWSPRRSGCWRAAWR